MDGNEVDEKKKDVVFAEADARQISHTLLHMDLGPYFVRTDKFHFDQYANLSAAQLESYEMFLRQQVEVRIEHLPSKRQDAPKAAIKLEIAPGHTLHRWLSSCCPRRFKENVLDELLATGTLMYQEALAAGDSRAAFRTRYAMRFWMLRAVFGGFVTGAFSLLGQFRRKSE
uniref:hypothetical protein n=1 Tax=Acidovorax sp. SUPP3334 TaxID=2920881 RepID=UPI002952949A|nr:hypothetical protein [Acidovorax sp. SUPP3334]BDH38376.1 hypothetical protein AVHM3334_23255 [Acidovorax sp. SUPP3334]